MNNCTKFHYIIDLTDDTGIIQHSIGSIPDPKSGYTTDDNSRAMIAAYMLYKNERDTIYLSLIRRYISYLNYVQTKNGLFRNIINYNRNFMEDDVSDDCFGRCIWSLGYILNANINDGFNYAVKLMIDKALPNLNNLNFLRSKAYSLLGLYYIFRYEKNYDIKRYIKKLTNDIIEEFNKNSSSEWNWFEDALIYDNGILPLSLLRSYLVLKDDKIKDIAFKAIKFLDNICFRYGYFKPIGCKGWYKKGAEIAEYDEQPIEACSMTLLYMDAYKLTNNEKYKKRALQCTNWYFGDNSKKIKLYDKDNGGCYDGITSYGVNKNEGAESIISLIISYYETANVINKK